MALPLLALLALLALVSVSSVVSGAELTAVQHGRMQKVVQAMLGLHPRKLHTEEALRGALGAMKPRYMMRLYERFKQSRAAVPDANSTVNTVRSIQAQPEHLKRKRLLVFNLSSVLASEEVLKAEIHVYKRKRKRRLDISADLYSLRRRTLRQLSTWKDVLTEPASGWKTYDVTSALKGCLAERRRRSLALEFSVSRHNGDVTPLTRKQFTRHMMHPFLVVFSNDVQNISLDQLESHFDDEALHESFVDPQTGVTEQFYKELQPPLKTNPGRDDSSEQAAEDDSTTGPFSARSRRSIHDNEIPMDTIKPPPSPPLPNVFNLPQTHPMILKGRPQLREQPPPRHRTIPYPDVFERRRRRRKHRKYRRQRNRGHKTTSFPFQWAVHGLDHGATQMSNHDNLCQRRKLVVDFADIGWREWIISPKSFEAHYCAGSCSFPMTRKLHPSNHATLQSLVQAVGLKGHVPTPCCVPDILSSVTLLYFDENYNVVLKNYPDMSVQSCACR